MADPLSPHDPRLVMLGHELQTVLTVVQGHTQLLGRRIAEESTWDPQRGLWRTVTIREFVRQASALAWLLQTGAWQDHPPDALAAWRRAATDGSES